MPSNKRSFQLRRHDHCKNLSRGCKFCSLRSRSRIKPSGGRTLLLVLRYFRTCFMPPPAAHSSGARALMSFEANSFEDLLFSHDSCIRHEYHNQMPTNVGSQQFTAGVCTQMCFEHYERQVRIQMKETGTVDCLSWRAQNCIVNAHVESSKVMRRCSGSVWRS